MQRLVIDTETGGFKANEHSLLTVGMLLVDVSPKKLSFIDEKHILIKHDEYAVTKSALRINGIDLFEHHKVGVFPDAALKNMHDFVSMHELHETPLLGHNLHFDLGFLRSLCDTCSSSFPFAQKWDDTLFMWRSLRRKGLVNPYKDGKLGTVAQHFGLDSSLAHNALEDCKITAHCFHEMMKMQAEE